MLLEMGAGMAGSDAICEPHDHDRKWCPSMHGERETGACCARDDARGERATARACASSGAGSRARARTRSSVIVSIVSSSALCSFMSFAVRSWIITSASAHDHDRERAWRPPMHGERERGACCVRGDGAGESERESDLALCLLPKILF